MDGDKTNNRLDNLEYCARKENMQHFVYPSHMGIYVQIILEIVYPMQIEIFMG
ncbi:HNH endonuclease [Anaerococcus sp. Marseille-Q5996]|uniref:HNH endonuclease n=1 Tax=Anaerococcus sp. Marseille-Q5996 TaxID=2972769 RepID=UPI00396785FB